MNLKYDVIIIGAGHAGCEAATAAANMGAKTCLVTMDMNKIAQMSCNPAIGGIAKGQIVREIDALGGQMGLISDATAIQFRMLNRSKGPAVWSPRAQCDREKFIWKWRETLDRTDNLDIWQDQVCEIITEGKNITGVKTIWGVEIKAKSVVITAGTFLNGLLHIGKHQLQGGRIAEPSVSRLTESIAQKGIRFGRMKTGTPVRIDKRSVHFEDLEKQDGENDFHKFSFMGTDKKLQQLPCWICYTNVDVHRTLMEAIDDSPLYNGQIKSIGPRYCPSIEDKVVRFADKDRHQVFIEPEGLYTNEMYLGGMSSSMPEDVQYAMYRTVPGLENVKIVRNAYAIEYDCINAIQLKSSLEFKDIKGLFSGGQINGSSGYEEAAAQGIVAGINAARYVTDKEPLILSRSESYIGVLIDDLVTKETYEPYRMMTSRAEYRLILRQDNADLRLSKYGHQVGLIDDDRMNKVIHKEELIKEEIERVKQVNIGTGSKVQELVTSYGSTELSTGVTLAELIKRPELSYEALAPIDPYRPELPADVQEQVNINLKYEGYIDRQLRQVEHFKKLENKIIPESLDYNDINGLRKEATQKLSKFRPHSIGQASRISGVSPADISVLLVYLESLRRK